MPSGRSAAARGRFGRELRVIAGIDRSSRTSSRACGSNRSFPTRAGERVRVARMALVVSVPLNTMLADLDETLRSLLKRELERHGFDGVEVAFDAPAREWSGQLSSPTVNLFLYDLRESQDARQSEWSTHSGNGGARDVRPP